MKKRNRLGQSIEEDTPSTPLTSVGDGSAIYLGPTDHRSILGKMRKRKHRNILDEIKKIRSESIKRMYT